jgi:hypothetical protein
MLVWAERSLGVGLVVGQALERVQKVAQTASMAWP